MLDKSKAMKIKKIYFISSLAVAVILAGGFFLVFFLKPKAVEYHLPVNLSQAELQDIASRINKNMENLTIFPKDYNVYLDLGSLEFALGNASKAIDYYTKAWEIIPTNATPWLNIGNIYIQLGLYNQAEAAFLKAKEANPSYYLIYFDIAKLYNDYLSEKADQVRGVYLEGLKATNNDPKLLDYFSTYLTKIGNYSEALQYLQVLIGNVDDQSASQVQARIDNLNTLINQ